ncbi:MAG: hypothetical protein AMXMBFR48_22400 [Ignavibacteriales bacterium]
MAGVNKMLFSILYFIRQETGSDFVVNPDIPIRDILHEEAFDELDLIIALIHFEMVHAVELPDVLIARKELTLREFAACVAELESIDDNDIPMFYAHKTSLISYLITTVKNSQWHGSNGEIPN